MFKINHARHDLGTVKRTLVIPGAVQGLPRRYYGLQNVVGFRVRSRSSSESSLT